MRNVIPLFFVVLFFGSSLYGEDKDFSFEYFFYSKGYDGGYREGYERGLKEGYMKGIQKAKEALNNIPRPNGVVPMKIAAVHSQDKKKVIPKYKKSIQKRKLTNKEKIEPVIMFFPSDDFHKKLFSQTKKPFRERNGKLEVVFLSPKKAKMFCVKNRISGEIDKNGK